MLKTILLILFVSVAAAAQTMTPIKSPDGKVVVTFWVGSTGQPRYEATVGGTPVIYDSLLGIVREDADFTRDIKMVSVSKSIPVYERYEILTAKRRFNDYRANRVTVRLQTIDFKQMDIIFQVSDDGFAFRYHFPEKSDVVRTIESEATTFRLPTDGRAWLQPMAEAGTGWEKSQPSYEEYYEKEIPVGTPSKLGHGWVFPALFRANDYWVVISETGVGRNYCGSRLRHLSESGEYAIGFPDARETMNPGEPYLPQSSLPWTTPWRVVAIGSLATVSESMLGVHLADKPKEPLRRDLPGKSSWSWVLLGDGKTEFQTQKRFIDYAADMGWKYCLIDALWDKQIGDEKIKELTAYARGKNVKIILWYNSAGAWNTTPQTPRGKLLDRDARRAEFARLKSIGIGGLKVDFFGGDGQSFMNYYLDLIEDAAEFGFAVNFHGATIPRGWQRTYPNLMTMEAVRGFEFVTFEQANAERQASHSAMLPFTRNIFDPMDFTPFAPGVVNPRIKRRTTSGFELATTVMFTSGIQHYAETPEGLAKTPKYVSDFLKIVPSVWDDVKFIDGYPGKFAVFARRAGNRWFICGINGEDQPRTVSIPLAKFAARRPLRLINDDHGGDLKFVSKTLAPAKSTEVTMLPRGGFVIY